MRLLLSAGLIALCSGAIAQDARGTDANWTGFYAGVGIGHSAIDIHTFVDTNAPWELASGNLPGGGYAAFAFPALSDAPPMSAHVLAGYGVQVGSAYVGLEGDLVWQGPANAPIWFLDDAFGPTGTDTSACPQSQYDLCIIDGGRSTLTTLGHARAIVGVVLDPKLMAFAAAGIAVAKAEAGFFNYIDNDGVTAGDFDIPSSLLTGVTLGGGVEFKPTDNLRIRLEGFVDSYPDWKARDETNLGDEQQGEPFVRSSLPLVSEIGSATGRVTVIWQF